MYDTDVEGDDISNLEQFTPQPSTSQGSENHQKRKAGNYDSLLLQALSTTENISKIISQDRQNQDDSDVFGKFVSSELRAIKDVSNDYMYRLAKRSIQSALLQVREQIDGQTVPADQ